MNNTCVTCGGFTGDFTWSGTGARICSCRPCTRERLKSKRESEWEKEFQIEMIPEVTHRIVALSGKITHRLVVKTSEIIGLEDFISSLLTKEREESDTYWKERVRETEQRYLLAFAGLDPAERHDEAVRVLRELDNLK